MCYMKSTRAKERFHRKPETLLVKWPPFSRNGEYGMTAAERILLFDIGDAHLKGENE